MTISAKIIADSISPDGIRIATLQLLYPRLIHSELMTHRVFSRNASSSRAIPVKKMLEMVRTDPAMPIHWGQNQPGMQAAEELTGDKLNLAKDMWMVAAMNAADVAEKMNALGLHKQVANRILEPFQHISVVLTATEFDNWDELRDHDDADPNIQQLAREIKRARNESLPKHLEYGEWHLPYVVDEDWPGIHNYAHRNREDAMQLACMISAARCCRASYNKHDGTRASIEEDLALCERLASARPIHASPFEHQATPMPDPYPSVYFTDDEVEVKGHVIDGTSHIDMDGLAWSGNFAGWIQHRKQIELSFK